ncbi:hypothetical protein GGS23DRAFT_292496 [Durotheca rogersii]|uniref:uncharacterized protein n=1 Tax=Durotheca rogersii TaxID=419775 RepID=UPI00221E99F2|nr:uncharacterized protein GGS23DRAFT_292496 [Durotheca rogersii]KAI5866859.1 hypothetical protein GGS23DRAFT_292496 [Durotheca rogersii]
MTAWTVHTNHLVEWGKFKEEERLTGRADTHGTVQERVDSLKYASQMVLPTLACLLISCNLVLRALDSRPAPPGQMFWVDGDRYELHVYCHGSRADPEGAILPAVLLEGEGPVEDGLQQLAAGAVNNGSISRYCFVDRPGFAWSDAAPSPLSAGMAVEAASEALAKAGEDGPWILAGADTGSIYSRIFSARHEKDIKGLLLIDPSHEEDFGAIGAPGKGFWLWVQGVLSPLGVDRIGEALFRGRTREDRVWGKSAYQAGQYAAAKLQENLVATTLSRREVDDNRAIQNPDTPLVLISSGVEIRRNSGWEDKQRHVSRLTRNLMSWDVVDQAPHQVWETYVGHEVIEDRLQQLVYGV